jgi:O-antigen/teichoic acid export membrane protein
MGLGLVALVARHEGVDGLGRYALVLTVVGITGALVDVGLTTYLTREVARERDANRQPALLGTVLLLKMGLAVVGALGLLALAALAPFPPEAGRLLPLGGLLLLPEAASGTIRAYVNGRQRMEISGAIDMVIRTAAFGVSVPLLLAGLGVGGVLVGTIGATLLGVAAYAIILRRWRVVPVYHASLATWRAYVRESYPFAVTSLAAMVYARIDLVLLGLWKGEVAAGWYAAGYRLWETIGLLPASLLDAMFPEMSRMAARPGGEERLRRLFRTGGWAMLGGGLLLALAGALAAGLLVPLVFGRGDDYGPAVATFRVLVWAIPAMFLYLLCGHTLYALDRQRQVTAVMLLVGVANIALNLAVIPRWSYLGCAWVAVFTEWLLVALLYPLARRALAR